MLLNEYLSSTSSEQSWQGHWTVYWKNASIYGDVSKNLALNIKCLWPDASSLITELEIYAVKTAAVKMY